jgi:hypothetical protein
MNMMAPSAGEQGGSSDSSVRGTKQLALFMQRRGDGTALLQIPKFRNSGKGQNRKVITITVEIRKYSGQNKVTIFLLNTVILRNTA